MKELPYIDVHCHLDLCADAKACVQRAREAGVGRIITQGVNIETNRKALRLSIEHNEVKAALGLYPVDALKLSDAKINEEIEFIRRKKSLIVAIGEVGIDFKEDDYEHEKQKYIFRKMIVLAKEMDKPIIVHSRKAEEECIKILEEMQAKGVIMHCFCGKLGLIKRIVSNGWFLTIPTNVKYSQQFQSLAKESPLTQLFCETDSPYLHPDKLKDNEPMNVVESYKILALLKGLPLDDVRAMVWKNYLRVFEA